MINHAKAYLEAGYSVFPIGKNKKPIVDWEHYQSEFPMIDEIEDWWVKYPNAGIGIVTGNLSNLYVVDGDSIDAYKYIKGLIGDIDPTVRSKGKNNGWHWWFRGNGHLLGNAQRVVSGVDFRGDGGYIVAPPSITDMGEPYHFIPKGSGIPETLPELPESVIQALKTRKSEYVPPKTNDFFANGRRDDDLFHIAETMTRGGCNPRMIEEVLNRIVQSWGENDGEWVRAKVQSALNRKKKRDGSLAEEVRKWVEDSDGIFMSSDVFKEFHLSSRNERKALSTILSRLKNDGVIEKYGTKNGVFRKLDDNVEWLDIENADSSPFDIRWPFQLENFINIPPKSLSIIAGEQNAGKTAFLLNTAISNMGRNMDVVFISSETNAPGLRVRLEGFDIPLSDITKAVKFGYKSESFADIIVPNAINIIDYLEIHDNFFAIGGQLKAIFDKLDKGIAIIGLQMDGKANVGRGGSFSLEKPTLYLTLHSDPPSGTKLTIRKAKWFDGSRNPNGLQMNYATMSGCNLSMIGDWNRGNKK